MKKLIKTIDKRQRVGAVHPTKVKTDKNVNTEPNAQIWTNPEYIIQAFERFGKEIARLKKQRRDRLKKRNYQGIELKNQVLHFWALNNYAERKKAENKEFNRFDVVRVSLPKKNVNKPIVNIDFDFKPREITNDLIELQLLREHQILQEQRDKKEDLKRKKALKLIEDFYLAEREKLNGFKPLEKRKLSIQIENFDFDFDFDL